jgi:hypothetical protein
MTQNLISRRTILRGAGIAIGLPWLEAMSSNAVLGSSSMIGIPKAAPVRAAFLYVPNGMHMPDWKPKETGTDFELPKTLQQIEKHRHNINVLSGLSLNGGRALGDGPGDHARSVASFLTGAHPFKTNGANIKNGQSVDQAAAEKIGKHTKLPSLELGTESSAKAGNCDSGYSCVYTSNLSWRTETSPVAKETNPRKVFERLFGGQDAQAAAKMNHLREKYRKSILDFAQEEANSLHTRLGTGDRRKLDEYLYAVRQIEQRLESVEKLDQVETYVPDFPRPEGVPREYAEHVKLLFDMMVLAFQTDSTRVVSFMFTNAGSNRPYRNLGIRRGHHDLSHHGKDKDKQKQIAEINRFHCSLLGYFLDQMSSIKEGERTLLDNSMILYGSGISDGNRHNHDDLPILLAGNAGGQIETGRHIKYRHDTPLTNLYLTMLDKLGAPTKTFGDSTGPIENL